MNPDRIFTLETNHGRIRLATTEADNICLSADFGGLNQHLLDLEEEVCWQENVLSWCYEGCPRVGDKAVMEVRTDPETGPYCTWEYSGDPGQSAPDPLIDTFTWELTSINDCKPYLHEVCPDAPTGDIAELCPQCASPVAISKCHTWDTQDGRHVAPFDPVCPCCKVQLAVKVPFVCQTDSGYQLYVAGPFDPIHEVTAEVDCLPKINPAIQGGKHD